LLPNLAKVPVLILTGEASYHAAYDHCTVKYLQQAGIPLTWIKLVDVGLRGNGHMMMLEKNNADIAAVMADWLDKIFAAPANCPDLRGSGCLASSQATSSGRFTNTR